VLEVGEFGRQKVTAPMPSCLKVVVALLPLVSAQNCMHWCGESDCHDQFMCGGCHQCRPHPPNPPYPPPIPAERCAPYPSSRRGGLCSWLDQLHCPGTKKAVRDKQKTVKDDGSECVASPTHHQAPATGTARLPP